MKNETIWPFLVYCLAQLAEWRLGRGKREGIDWFARVGLDFCRMGVTLYGVLVYNAIDGNASAVKFNNVISSVSNSRGVPILFSLVVIAILWSIAFISDKKQLEISKIRKKSGWTKKKIRNWRGFYGGIVNAIGWVLFIIPLYYLF